jgi:hypothetical protein
MFQDPGEFVGGAAVPARDAALVIQRAYRRYLHLNLFLFLQ